MSLDNVRERASNRLIDFLSAIVAGLAVWLLDFFNTPQFLRASMSGMLFQRALIKVGAFALAAVLVIAWKHRWRARWGWILIAIVSVVITATIDEFLYRRTVVDPDFFAGLSPFPMEIVLFLLPALLFMGVMHYLGVAIEKTFRGAVNSA